MKKSKRTSGPYLHELKCWPHYFQAIVDGRKRFEFRVDDRQYRVGDDLKLLEFDPYTGQYSGRVAFVRVDYLMESTAACAHALPAGYVIMSIGTPFVTTSERFKSLYVPKSKPSVDALKADAANEPGTVAEGEDPQ